MPHHTLPYSILPYPNPTLPCDTLPYSTLPYPAIPNISRVRHYLTAVGSLTFPPPLPPPLDESSVSCFPCPSRLSRLDPGRAAASSFSKFLKNINKKLKTQTTQYKTKRNQPKHNGMQHIMRKRRRNKPKPKQNNRRPRKRGDTRWEGGREGGR